MNRARLLATILVSLAVVNAADAQGVNPVCEDTQAKEQVDLGEPLRDPTLLVRVRERRPDHYARIIGLLDSFLSVAPPFDPRVAQDRYGAKLICAQQLQMTLPPKIVTQFTMDQVRYRATVKRGVSRPPD